MLLGAGSLRGTPLLGQSEGAKNGIRGTQKWGLRLTPSAIEEELEGFNTQKTSLYLRVCAEEGPAVGGCCGAPSFYFTKCFHPHVRAPATSRLGQMSPSFPPSQAVGTTRQGLSYH